MSMPTYGFEDAMNAFRSLGRESSHKPESDTDTGFSTLFSPIYPYNRWAVLTPFVSVAGAATVFLLTGVAAAALVVMSFALLVVVFLLSEVFGYEIAMPQMAR